MKKQLLVYFLAISSLFTCNNQQNELSEINSFLKANYEFNNKTLKKYKEDYYQLIEEQPIRKIEKLNLLDSKFKLLISNIDNAISNKETNLEYIISESNDILNEVQKILIHRKDYLLTEFKHPKNNSDELALKYLKNRLVIAMAYVFEFGSISNTLFSQCVRSVPFKSVFL